MSNVDKIKLIEAYHTGQLKGKEKSSFKRLLQEDPSFKTEVAAYEPIFDGFAGLRTDQFAETVQEFEQEYQAQQQQQKPTVVRSLRQFYYLAAAAAVLLLSVLAYQLNHPNLFQQNFVASESIAVYMNGYRAAHDMPMAEQLKKQAFEAYQDKDYRSCIRLLQDYRQNFPEIANKDYQALVVLGVAQLAKGKAEAALEALGKVTTSRDSSYRQEAEWMTALANIKLDKREIAKAQLEIISKKENHLYQQKAATLLEDL